MYQLFRGTSAARSGRGGGRSRSATPKATVPVHGRDPWRELMERSTVFLSRFEVPLFGSIRQL